MCVPLWVQSQQLCHHGGAFFGLMRGSPAEHRLFGVSGRQYSAHVRLHFVTNLGVAGGLILLQNFGAGR